MRFAEGFARDVGCRADLLWRCDLLDARQTAAWVQAATTTEFSSVPDSSRLGVAVFEDARLGHRIVAVLRTGRVQLRLDAMTPKSERVQQARKLFERLQGVGADSDLSPAEAG